MSALGQKRTFLWSLHSPSLNGNGVGWPLSRFKAKAIPKLNHHLRRYHLSSFGPKVWEQKVWEQKVPLLKAARAAFGLAKLRSPLLAKSA